MFFSAFLGRIKSNTTKYALKRPKLVLQSRKTCKKSLSTLSDPPPSTLIHNSTFYNNII